MAITDADRKRNDQLSQGTYPDLGPAPTDQEISDLEEQVNARPAGLEDGFEIGRTRFEPWPKRRGRSFVPLNK
jgi:hypothetical protein